MPQAIGAAILTAIAVADVVVIASVTLSTIVGYAVITGVMIGLQFLLPKPEMPKQEDGSQAIRQSIPPRNGAYGRVRLAGAYMLYEVNEGTSYDVLAVVSGKIGGFVGYYLHEDSVELDENGIVQEFEDERYGDDLIQIKTRIGEPVETAYTELTEVLPAEIWNEDYRGDGIASVMLRCHSPQTEDIQKRYPQGLPEPSFVLDGYPIWDPRATSPVQSRDDPDTWQVSTNPVLQLIDYLTHPDHGMGLDYHAIIEPVLDQLMEEADLCDELVPRKLGMEPRYESAGWFTFDTKPESVIGAILATCDGWMAENGDGTLSLFVGAYRAPTDARHTLTAKHILAFDFSFGVADEERVNEIAISFTSPEHRFKDTQLEPWRDEDDISESGIIRSRGLVLGWVQSHPQARRLAKRAMARFQAAIQGNFTTDLCGIAIMGRRWVRVQYPYISGMEDVVVEIQRADVDLMEGRVTFEFATIDPDTIDDWDPETEEGDPPPVPELMASSSIGAPQNVEAYIEDGSLLVEFDDMSSTGGNFNLKFRVRFRVLGQDAWTTTGTLDAEAIGGSPVLRMRVNAGVVPTAATLQVQIQTIAPSGAGSDWVPEPPASTNTADGIPDPPLNFDHSEDAGVVTLTWTNPNSPSMYAARVYLGDNPPPALGTSLIAGPLFGAANQAMQTTHSPGSGTHNYWVTAGNSAGEESTPAGPEEVTIP
jgi:hypothetical protein